jgi:hypothetical protein
MSDGRPPSPPERRPCKVTVVVPEGCAVGSRLFATELRARYRAGSPHKPREWRALSPSAALMVDPERRARCAVRDTRAPGADRFLWSVTLLDRFRTIAEGRAGELAKARQHAEAALRTHAPDWRDSSGD